MLRRRRTCNPEELSLSLGSFVRDNSNEDKRKKRKLSPFPETSGEYLTNSELKTRSYGDAVITTAPTSAKQTGKHAHPPAPLFIKPSEVVTIEKKMALAQFPGKASSISEAPPSSSSIWDSVVAWMRSAVEFVGLEATPTAGTSSTRGRFSSSRKRPLGDSNVIDEQHQNKSKPLRNIKKGRRMTLGPGALERYNKEKSSEGVGLELLTTPTRNSEKLKAASNKSLVSSAAQKYTQSSWTGLNEVPSLDLTGANIRNPSLRKYYASSSENKEEKPVRRSPRLAAAKNKSSVPPAPPPPPPPPPPPLPSSSSIPPPPPPLSRNHGIIGTPMNNSPSSASRCTLQQMQSRLRNKMMKKGSSMEENRNQNTPTKMNIRAKQWAEIQARKRKMPLKEFLVLAAEKKKELELVLKKLEVEMPPTMDKMRCVVEEVQDASQWFSGGSKEMKEELPLYKSLEHKLELMTECVQIQTEMAEVVSDVNPIYQRSTISSPHSHLDQLRTEFHHRNKNWGQVIMSDGKAWSNACLPVDCELLCKARVYLGSVVSRYTDLIEAESAKVGGVMCSIKSHRVSRIKNGLKEGLSLVSEILAYCSEDSQCNSVSPSSCSDGSSCGSSCFCCGWGLDRACVLVEHFVDVCLMEYDGHISCQKRQEVCEHFQSILKTLTSLKGMVTKFPNLSKKAKKSGVMSVLKSSDRLSNLLYSSCVKLIHHIETQSKVIISSAHTPSNSREIMLWMIFGCKYVNSVLEAIGSRQADEKGVKDLLQQLQQMEALIPE